MLSTFDAIALCETQGISRSSLARILPIASKALGDTFGDKDLLDLLSHYHKQFGIRRPPDDIALALGYQAAERIIDDSEKIGVSILTLLDPTFPARLLQIPDPPPIIYLKGSERSANAPLSIAVVGTRSPTRFGRISALRIGQLLSEYSYVVVSGLAKGCDAQAHRGVILGGGQTVAVLAHGADRIYPAENRELAFQILDLGGCWISEYPPGSRIFRSNFVERDRLQPGLSDALIVIETGVDGGSMHAVTFAQKQGRRIACLEHPAEYVTLSETGGNAFLITNHLAFPIYNKSMLDSFLDIIHPERSHNSTKPFDLYAES